MKQEDWSGNLPAMLEDSGSDPDPDPIELFRRGAQTLLGRKLGKGETIGRVEAEILVALARTGGPQSIVPDED